MDEFEKDDAVWELVTKDVTPIKRSQTSSKKKPVKTEKTKKQEKNTPAPVAPPPSPVPKSKELDKRSLQRLQKGQMQIEGRLDLHGHNQDSARRVFTAFIQQAYMAQKRCLLVITGHGKRQKQNEEEGIWAVKSGILRQRVQEWSGEGALSDIILKIIPAQPKDGGEGAFYVYLRKNKP